MAEIPIQITGPGGEPLGRLRIGAMALIADAEQTARDKNLTKCTALPMVLRELLEQGGFNIEDNDLEEAVRSIDLARSGVAVGSIHVKVRASSELNHEWRDSAMDFPVYNRRKEPLRRYDYMAAAPKSVEVVNFFEMEQIFPNVRAQALYEGLVGLDDQKEKLIIEMEMLLFPEKLEQWSRRHHNGRILRLIELQSNRVPLVLLEGDVGTGKTVLAETVGDALARRIGRKTRVHLLKINTQVRGSGQVGEMSDLIVQAFTQAEVRAKTLKNEPVLLLLDEADALAARRDNHQMHHEDKAGLDTLLQRLDNLRLTRLPIMAFFITNRLNAIDPAVRRRAALSLFFDRPNDEARAGIIRQAVPELNLSHKHVNELVRLTSEHEPKNKGIPFTASDLTDKLLPSALRRAYTEQRLLRVEDLLDEAGRLEPSPPMGTS